MQIKILLITGIKSFDEISAVAEKVNINKKLNIKCTIKKASVNVSAFITEKHIETIWNSLEEHDFNFILIPGFAPWDAQDLSTKLNIPIYKGTRFSGDLHNLILNIRGLQLSTVKAADSLLKDKSEDKIRDFIKEKINEYESGKIEEIKEKFLIFEDTRGKKKYAGGVFPPLLFAEIVDAPKLSDEQILKKIGHYMASGANVLDIGMIFHQNNSKFIRRIIPLIKKKYDILISIDSVDINEITAALDMGVDFILSIDGGNVDDFISYCEKNNIDKKIGIILIPLDTKQHTPLKNNEEEAKLLILLAKKLTEYGFTNLMYDSLMKTPISPGFCNSVNNYHILYEVLKDFPDLKYPVFMGFNNVFELVDADSSGLNVLLSLIAMETNCGGILSTEFSAKTLGAISETRKGINLAYLAKISKSPPINLGFDAFFVKSKRHSLKRSEMTDVIIDVDDFDLSENLNEEILSKIKAKNVFIHDKTGYVKIYANHDEKKIELLFIPFEITKKRLGTTGSFLVKGSDAESIYKTLDRLGLITEISHAFYIGKELSKAETALKLNTSYFEDTEIL